MINFKNYRYAYVQCETIYKLIQNDTINMKDELGDLISTLKVKWQGEDSPLHINNLSLIYNFLSEFIDNSTEVLVKVTDRVVNIQEAVFRISGGAAADNKITNQTVVEKLEEIDKTAKYHLEDLSVEYSTIENMCTEFARIDTLFATYFNAFFENWVDDPEKEQVKTNIESMLDKFGDCKEKLNDAKDAMHNVVESTTEIL